MNLRQPYEQLIADKLRKLPAPDADASWQQMKRLLDDDEDTRAGSKRPPGSPKGWWRTGIIAIVLLTSLWLYVEKTTVPGTVLAKNNKAMPSNSAGAETGNSPSKKTNTTNNKTATIDNTITLPATDANTGLTNNDKINAAIIPASTIKAGVKNELATDGEQTRGNKMDAAGNGLLTGRQNSIIKNNTRNPYGTVNDFSMAAGSSGNDKRPRELSATTGHYGSYNKTGGGLRTGVRAGDKTSPVAGNDINNTDGLATAQYLPVSQPSNTERTWFEQLNDLKISQPIPSAHTALPGDSIENNRNTDKLLNNETKKLVAKAQRDRALEDMSKKEKKWLNLDLSNVFKPFSLHMDAEPRWAAGIALNSGITLNAQNRYNYNMNAKSGTLSDYIPSLYLQFHLNDYVYMQTELNFISPQYTPQLLVYQQSNDMGAQPGISRQKSVYIQKLYYFNLPVSLHYSPVNNLYFSAGLQFSSFQSGLVSIQEKQYATLSGPDHPNDISNTVLKFKDDSIAARISPNEWRWQAGADYYWNRFNIGMRYNRSFKTLLNPITGGSLPATSIRNESLIFFVRYNLFESRKKGG